MSRFQKFSYGFLIWSVLTAMGFQLLSATGYAADDTQVQTKGISISPPLKEIVLGPGLIEARTTVTVKNTTGTDMSARIELVDFKALDEFGGVSLGQAGALPGKYGLANWMKLAGSSTVALPNGVSVDIPVLVTNSDDLQPGGHYGAVVVTAQTTEASTATKVNLRQELVSLLFVKKLGGETYGLNLQSVKPDKTTELPTSINLRFESTGNTQVIPRGYIEITDPKGRLVSKGIINPESTLVLPETSRQFITLMQSVSSASAPGRYTTTVYFRHDGQKDFTTNQTYSTYGRAQYLLLAAAVLGSAIAVVVIVLILKRRPKSGKRSK